MTEKLFRPEEVTQYPHRIETAYGWFWIDRAFRTHTLYTCFFHYTREDGASVIHYADGDKDYPYGPGHTAKWINAFIDSTLVLRAALTRKE